MYLRSGIPASIKIDRHDCDAVSGSLRTVWLQTPRSLLRSLRLCGIIRCMLVRLIGPLAFSLALGFPTAALERHSAKVGPLVVTATGISNTASSREDSHAVVVFLTIANSGQTAACFSFSTKLRGTYDLEYSNSPLGLQAPGAPEVWQMLPGEVSKGAYVFDVRNGIDARELLVIPQSKSSRCDFGHEGRPALWPRFQDHADESLPWRRGRHLR